MQQVYDGTSSTETDFEGNSSRCCKNMTKIGKNIHEFSTQNLMI
jgi:hypothetical protein